MSVDDLLDELDDLLDKAWSVPLAGGRCIVDVEHLRSIVDDVRLNLPTEIRQARAIVSDRSTILQNAKSEASGIVRAAEEKARAMVSSDAVVKQAQEKAAAIQSDSAERAKEVRRAAAEFADGLLRNAEDSMGDSLAQLKKARQALKTPAKR